MIASVGIPYFAAAIERRDAPSLAGIPLLIGEYAVSPEAARRGVQPGMSLAQAQALVPDIQYVPFLPARYRQARDEVETNLMAYSPLVEATDRPHWYIGFGNTRMAEAMALTTQMVQKLQQATGYITTTGLASGKFPAYVANTALQPTSVLLVYPGSEAVFLSPFPVSFLPLEPDAVQRLQHLGNPHPRPIHDTAPSGYPGAIWKSRY